MSKWQFGCAAVFLAVIASTAWSNSGATITGPGMELAAEICTPHGGVNQIKASRLAHEIKCKDGLMVSTDLNLVHDKVFTKKG
jgi:hypothetical protein